MGWIGLAWGVLVSGAISLAVVQTAAAPRHHDAPPAAHASAEAPLTLPKLFAALEPPSQD